MQKKKSITRDELKPSQARLSQALCLIQMLRVGHTQTQKSQLGSTWKYTQRNLTVMNPEFLVRPSGLEFQLYLFLALRPWALWGWVSSQMIRDQNSDYITRLLGYRYLNSKQIQRKYGYMRTQRSKLRNRSVMWPSIHAYSVEGDRCRKKEGTKAWRMGGCVQKVKVSIELGDAIILAIWLRLSSLHHFCNFPYRHMPIITHSTRKVHRGRLDLWVLDMYSFTDRLNHLFIYKILSFCWVF